MRYLRYLFLAVLAICLVTVALANRGPVTLYLLSGDLAGWVGLERYGIPNSIELPLFMVIFASIVAGLLIGLVWEWLREHRIRADAAATRRDRDQLQREIGKLRENTGKQKDDVLALLEGQT